MTFEDFRNGKCKHGKLPVTGQKNKDGLICIGATIDIDNIIWDDKNTLHSKIQVTYTYK